MCKPSALVPRTRGWDRCWVSNRLDDGTQRVVVHSSTSMWRPVRSGFPWLSRWQLWGCSWFCLPGGRWGSPARSTPRQSSLDWAAAPSGSSHRTWLLVAAEERGRMRTRGGPADPPLPPSHPHHPALPAAPPAQPGTHQDVTQHLVVKHVALVLLCQLLADVDGLLPHLEKRGARTGPPQCRVNWERGQHGPADITLPVRALAPLPPVRRGRGLFCGDWWSSGQQKDLASHHLQPWR